MDLITGCVIGADAGCSHSGMIRQRRLLRSQVEEHLADTAHVPASRRRMKWRVSATVTLFDYLIGARLQQQLEQWRTRKLAEVLARLCAADEGLLVADQVQRCVVVVALVQDETLVDKTLGGLATGHEVVRHGGR